MKIAENFQGLVNTQIIVSQTLEENLKKKHIFFSWPFELWNQQGLVGVLWVGTLQNFISHTWVLYELRLLHISWNPNYWIVHEATRESCLRVMAQSTWNNPKEKKGEKKHIPKSSICPSYCMGINTSSSPDYNRTPSLNLPPCQQQLLPSDSRATATGFSVCIIIWARRGIIWWQF